MMKKLLLAVVALTSVFGAAFAQAGLVVNIDPLDRPFAIHGPRYAVGPTQYVWVPGHYNRYHVWKRGHYKRLY